MPDLEAMKDRLMALECRYGADDPRSVTLRRQIEALIRERQQQPGSLSHLTIEETKNLLWGE